MTPSHPQELLAQRITDALSDLETDIFDPKQGAGFLMYLDLDAVKRTVLDVIVKEQAIIRELT